jgi:hypothetical protein
MVRTGLNFALSRSRHLTRGVGTPDATFYATVSIRQPYAEQIPAVVIRPGAFSLSRTRDDGIAAVRRYTHILALRNAEWVCDPLRVSEQAVWLPP